MCFISGLGYAFATRPVYGWLRAVFMEFAIACDTELLPMDGFVGSFSASCPSPCCRSSRVLYPMMQQECRLRARFLRGE